MQCLNKEDCTPLHASHHIYHGAQDEKARTLGNHTVIIKKTLLKMEKFSFTVSAVFSSDKSITFELIPEAVAFLRANGCLAEGKTKGSWGMAPDGKTMEIRPYAQADPVRKIVKDEEKVGAFTTLQRLKTKCRVTTALPTDLTNDLAKRLYEEDAALVAEAIGKGALRPTVVDLSAVTEISNPQPAA